MALGKKNIADVLEQKVHSSRLFNSFGETRSVPFSEGSCSLCRKITIILELIVLEFSLFDGTNIEYFLFCSALCLSYYFSGLNAISLVVIDTLN